MINSQYHNNLDNLHNSNYKHNLNNYHTSRHSVLQHIYHQQKPYHRLSVPQQQSRLCHNREHNLSSNHYRGQPQKQIHYHRHPNMNHNKSNNSSIPLNQKTLNEYYTKYNEYLLFDEKTNDIKKIKSIFKKNTPIIYVLRNKFKKYKINRVMTDNILEIYRGKKIKYIYLHENIIFYKPKSSLRDVLEDIINNNFTIN